MHPSHLVVAGATATDIIANKMLMQVQPLLAFVTAGQCTHLHCCMSLQAVSSTGNYDLPFFCFSRDRRLIMVLSQSCHRNHAIALHNNDLALLMLLLVASKEKHIENDCVRCFSRSGHPCEIWPLLSQMRHVWSAAHLPYAGLRSSTFGDVS